MTLKLNTKFIFAFLFLTFLLHELHELVHTSVGRMLCGCWGSRDFNFWTTCEGCSDNLSLWATFAGPVFTFVMIWVGVFLLKPNKSIQQKSIGFALIFANLPFGRLLNPALGGGDEVVVLDQFVQNWDLSRLIIFFLVLLIVAYPLYKAFQIIENKRKIAFFCLFFFVPLIIDLVVVLGGMNSLYSANILTTDWILGSPMLVTIWTFFNVVLFFLFRKNIRTLGKTDK